MVRKSTAEQHNCLQKAQLQFGFREANKQVANLRRNLFRGGIPEETFAVSLPTLLSSYCVADGSSAGPNSG